MSKLKNWSEKVMGLVGKEKRYWIVSFTAMDSEGEYQDIQTYSTYLGEFLCNQCVVSIRGDLGDKGATTTTLARRFYKKIEKVIQVGYTINITGYHLVIDDEEERLRIEDAENRLQHPD